MSSVRLSVRPFVTLCIAALRVIVQGYKFYQRVPIAGLIVPSGSLRSSGFADSNALHSQAVIASISSSHGITDADGCCSCARVLTA